MANAYIDLKYLLYLERFLGIRVEPFESDENVHNILYPLLLIGLNIVYIAFRAVRCSCYGGFNLKCCSPMTIHTIVRGVFAIYNVCTGIRNHNINSTVIRKLNKVENYMTCLDFKLPGNQTERIVTYMSLALYSVHVVESVYLFIGVIFFGEDLSLFEAFISTFYDAIKCTMYFSCMLLLTKCHRIQHGIKNEIDSLYPKIVQERVPDIAVIQVRQAWTEDTLNEKLHVIKIIQGVLSDCEEEIKSTYCVFVFWITVVSAVSTPAVGMTFLLDTMSITLLIKSTMVLYFVFLTTTIVFYSKLTSMKQLCNKMLCNILQRKSNNINPENIQRQIQECIQSPLTWNVYFFDLTYSLLFSILEIFVMVCSIYISSEK